MRLHGEVEPAVAHRRGEGRDPRLVARVAVDAGPAGQLHDLVHEAAAREQRRRGAGAEQHRLRARVGRPQRGEGRQREHEVAEGAAAQHRDALHAVEAGRERGDGGRGHPVILPDGVRLALG